MTPPPVTEDEMAQWDRELGFISLGLLLSFLLDRVAWAVLPGSQHIYAVGVYVVAMGIAWHHLIVRPG